MSLDNSEIYIFIGFESNTYYFVHTICNNKIFNKEISHKIYNILIDNNILNNLNENIIIYEFDTLSIQCDVICIQHSKKLNFVQYHKKLLEDFFQLILLKYSSDTDKINIYSINYDYEKKDYSVNQINRILNYFNQLNLPKNKLIINKIYQIVT